MKKRCVHTSVRLLVVLAILLLGHNMVRADDFSGAWVMNSNGWKYTLKLEQKDDTVTGTRTGINNDQKDNFKGKINGNEITFTLDGGEEFRGYMLDEGPAKTGKNQAVAGIFKAGDRSYGWYATR